MRRTILRVDGARALTVVGFAVVLAVMLWVAATAPPTTMSSSAAFAQYGPSEVKLDHTEGPAGTQVTGIGKNWPPGHHIRVLWGAGDVLLKEGIVDKSSNFRIPFTVPPNATPGDYTIKFHDVEGRTFQTATFRVTQAGPPSGSPPNGSLLISGKVVDANGNGLPGVTIRETDASGEIARNSTDTDGTYHLGDQSYGTYTVTPSKQGYTFSPQLHEVKLPQGATGNATGVDFTATKQATGTGDAFTYPMDLAQRTWFVGYNRHPVIGGNHPCYGQPYKVLWHAGEDWGGSINTAINAVAPGVVRYSSKLRNGALEDPSTTTTYPGGVVIIEHTLPNGSNIWSMYGHLDPKKITVSKGDHITQGNLKIADGLIKQTYNGNDNTHLHWEMRYFLDGSGINSKASNYKTTCAGIPGPGYTYPGHPDNFVANGGAGKEPYRWTDPSAFIKAH